MTTKQEGYQANRKRRYTLILVCLFLAACEGMDAPNVQSEPTCIPPNSIANPYNSTGESMAGPIYQAYKSGLPLKDAQLQAFRLLTWHMQRWSDYVDIPLEDGLFVRITVTYISPDLVQFIVLNHELRRENMIPDDFEADLKTKMLRLKEREELLFFMLVTTPLIGGQMNTGQQVVLDIPLSKMTLTNASDEQVNPVHDDHVLEEPIWLSEKPAAGFVGFPLAVMKDEQCGRIMDPKYDISITLDIPSLTVNNRQFNSQSWSIQYDSLIHSGANMDLLTFMPDPTYDYNRISPLKLPPVPVRDSSVAERPGYWTEYWEDLARYLWHRIMLEDYP